jgi:hypothetical protein
MNGSGLYVFEDHKLFDFLDGLYSYLSIYLFSVYLMLSNHYELRTELFIIQTILLSLVYISIGAVVVLPITAFLTLTITGFHYQKMNSVSFYNPYLYAGIIFAAIDMTCFFIAINYEYNYLHAVHHLIAFNLPIVVDKYVSSLVTEHQAIRLESPVITAMSPSTSCTISPVISPIISPAMMTGTIMMTNPITNPIAGTLSARRLAY